MALIGWNPWGELSSLHEQMDELFQQIFGEPLTRREGGAHLALPVDVRQTESSYVLEASIPGFTPEEVEVTYDDGVLTISGDRHAERESKEGEYVRRERRTSSVFRQVILPGEIQPDGIAAAFDNGVLTVTVPRVPKPQPKRIPVAAAGPERVGAGAR
jgi:HSP20 family protein